MGRWESCSVKVTKTPLKPKGLLFVWSALNIVFKLRNIFFYPFFSLPSSFFFFGPGLSQMQNQYSHRVWPCVCARASGRRPSREWGAALCGHPAGQDGPSQEPTGDPEQWQLVPERRPPPVPFGGGHYLRRHPELTPRAYLLGKDHNYCPETSPRSAGFLSVHQTWFSKHALMFYTFICFHSEGLSGM